MKLRSWPKLSGNFLNGSSIIDYNMKSNVDSIQLTIIGSKLWENSSHLVFQECFQKYNIHVLLHIMMLYIFHYY